jgi:hypothetical protein
VPAKTQIKTIDEAEILSAKLALIWDMQTVRCNSESAFHWRGEGQNGAVSVNWSRASGPAIRWYAKDFCISFGSPVGVYLSPPDECHKQEQQNAIPAFRRNCWLSGCDVECSAHEQAEWNLWLKEKATTAA